MDLLLWNHDEYNRYFNCSFYDVNQVPLEKRQHKIAGSLFLIAYVIFMVLYCLCIYGMLKSEHRKQTAYKLMIALGFNHLLGLQTGGLINGLFAYYGVVHCSCPTLNYTLSILAFANWYASSLANLILAINRCCELYDSNVANMLFDGWKIYIWQFGPVLYASLAFVFDSGRSYSSIWMAFLYDPHAGYSNSYGEKYYSSKMHLIHNNVVLSSEVIVYVAIIFMYYRVKHTASAEFQSRLRHERKIYFQVVLVGMSHLTAGILYLIMIFIQVTFAISLLGTTAYFMSQSTPALIYLCINKTIRRSIKAGLCGIKSTSSVSSNTVIKDQVMETI